MQAKSSRVFAGFGTVGAMGPVQGGAFVRAVASTPRLYAVDTAGYCAPSRSPWAVVQVAA